MLYAGQCLKHGNALRNGDRAFIQYGSACEDASSEVAIQNSEQDMVCERQLVVVVYASGDVLDGNVIRDGDIGYVNTVYESAWCFERLDVYANYIVHVSGSAYRVSCC